MTEVAEVIRCESAVLQNSGLFFSLILPESIGREFTTCLWLSLLAFLNLIWFLISVKTEKFYVAVLVKESFGARLEPDIFLNDNFLSYAGPS